LGGSKYKRKGKGGFYKLMGDWGLPRGGGGVQTSALGEKGNFQLERSTVVGDACSDLLYALVLLRGSPTDSKKTPNVSIRIWRSS